MPFENTIRLLLPVFFLIAAAQNKKQLDSSKTDDWPVITKKTNQQVIYSSSNMPRVDIHTHMDSKTNYAKAVDSMDQWGGTISISLAGLFWVKDNNGDKAVSSHLTQTHLKPPNSSDIMEL